MTIVLWHVRNCWHYYYYYCLLACAQHQLISRGSTAAASHCMRRWFDCCRTAISFSSARQRSSFEQGRWHSWSDFAPIVCERAADWYRRWFVVGLRDSITSSCNVQFVLCRRLVEACWHDGQLADFFVFLKFILLSAETLWAFIVGQSGVYHEIVCNSFWILVSLDLTGQNYCEVALLYAIDVYACVKVIFEWRRHGSGMVQAVQREREDMTCEAD